MTVGRPRGKMGVVFSTPSRLQQTSFVVRRLFFPTTAKWYKCEVHSKQEDLVYLTALECGLHVPTPAGHTRAALLR